MCLSDDNMLTKLVIDEQALAEAGDKGEKNLGFYTGRSKNIILGDCHPNIYTTGRSNIIFSS